MPTAPLPRPGDQERNSVVSAAKDLAEKKCKGTRWLSRRNPASTGRQPWNEAGEATSADLCKTLQALATTNSRERDEAATRSGTSDRARPAPGRWARRETAGTVQWRDHTACRHRCAGGGERSDRQPGPQRETGRRRHHPPVRARRPGRAGLRAPGTAAAAQRGPGGPDHAGAGEPDIPGPGAGHRPGADPPGLHPRARHPDPRRLHRGRTHGDAGGPRGRGHHLRLRAARGHHRGHAALRATARPGRAVRAGGRVLAVGAGAVHLPRRPGRDDPRGDPPGLPRPHPDRARARTEAVRARAAQDRGLRAGRAGPVGARRGSRGVGAGAALAVHPGGRPGGRVGADRPELHRGRLRQRHDGPGRHTGRPPAGPGSAHGLLGGRLRRLPADRLHGPAADHRPQAGPGDGPGRGAHAPGGDRRYARPAQRVRVHAGAGGAGLDGLGAARAAGLLTGRAPRASVRPRSSVRRRRCGADPTLG
ncbi:hypothetical protein SGPA1_31062 [Streptomyces misionensis JCM 4497]